MRLRVIRFQPLSAIFFMECFVSQVFYSSKPRLCLKAFRATSTIRKIHIARTVEDVRKFRSSIGLSKLGFVPTMGALHGGHISLVHRAVKECDIVAASIFVNPTQFSVGEDLDKYPRTFDKDVQMLEAAGVDFVFAPIVSEIYRNNVLCHIEPSDFSLIHEGKARPDFFRGVATIVCKLFNIMQPNLSYFGQKDISQCILIKKMIEDLNMPGEIRVCETLREEDGLAMSSRNTYLTPAERTVANILYRALSSARVYCEARDGETLSKEDLVAIVERVLASEPMVSRVEYVSVASYTNMKELEKITLDTGAVISSAVRVGSVRLIDNVLFGAARKNILDR